MGISLSGSANAQFATRKTRKNKRFTFSVFYLDFLWGQNINVSMTLKVCACDIQTVLFDSASTVLGIL